MTAVTSGNLVAGIGSVVWPDRYQYVTVMNDDGVNGLWVTTDGSMPTVGGDDCYVVPAGGMTLLANGAPVWYQGQGTPSPGTTINMTSESATAAYSVSAAG